MILSTLRPGFLLDGVSVVPTLRIVCLSPTHHRHITDIYLANDVMTYVSLFSLLSLKLLQ